MKKINRPIYMQKLLDYKDKEAVKVITSLRRSGKSSILELFRKYLVDTGVSPNNIFYLIGM